MKKEEKPPHEIIKLVTNSFCLYKFNNQVHFVPFFVCVGMCYFSTHCYFFLFIYFFCVFFFHFIINFLQQSLYCCWQVYSVFVHLFPCNSIRNVQNKQQIIFFSSAFSICLFIKIIRKCCNAHSFGLRHGVHKSELIMGCCSTKHNIHQHHQMFKCDLVEGLVFHSSSVYLVCELYLRLLCELPFLVYTVYLKLYIVIRY